ncbi:EAL domain-containing protein [Bradyrhizobium sp. KBS0727]|uniref:bifunctional diguanylate cyclase/phosphodiesterase n=1 Tax=unclassified Bradyrhizobium TaxID=2631580 RepID=UPI00110F0DA0|nr:MULTISPECIES: GAF domain-containing protein [unclassified Bradyrhizobium]QDW36617.1 EAL domain-containing protein [Bradyrhizobium sp. KBS0725]QDW43218.1 EAL domain-containing protein [Bradyrhizobium sp. KBS0727]
MKTEIVRTFAALNATNEAILYAKSPEELYRKVSEAAFFSGDFLASAIFLLEPGTDLLRFAAGCGDDIARLRSIDISVVAGAPEGSGVCGQAFRDQRVIISNDFLHDARSLAWRDGALTGQVGAAAALPLTCNGRSVGVFLVTRREPGSLSRQIISMLERVSANVSFALDNFDHEAARKDGERAMRRLNRMFGAISATNEAILRAKTEQELYQRVCDAAVHSGKSVATAVLLAEAGSTWLKPVAGTGESLHLITRSSYSIDPDNEYGEGIAGEAFRTQRPCVNDDLATTMQGGSLRQAQRDSGAMACVAVPLTRGGRSVGVLLFFVGKSWAVDEEIIALLARIAENVSFALDNFERASEKATADQQQERLTRMFAALSATNEAIMRAKSRAELYKLVCEAAANGGRFKSASIMLARADSDYPDMVAAAGPTAENMRQVRISFSAAHREGLGLCGNAFRSRQACVANDLRSDARGATFQKFIFSDGARSGAAFPLFVAGQPVGVMFFISSEKDTFTSEFAEMLQRLADNVSFALENFDRADEKARTEGQRERLARMLAALSATNEAIIRARSRGELFELVCEAAAQGGKFTSTSIALTQPDSDYLDVVAAAGPTVASAREVKLSVNEAHPEGRGVGGTAIRSRRPDIINDYLADPRSQAFHARARNDGANSGAAFPLFVQGRVVGVMVYISLEKDTFTPEFAELLQRLADNVSFALENFDRADEKARTEEQKERLGRMFAALSATNEAIMRAKSRTELFELVCEAAATGGKFTSTTIALAKPGSDYLDVVATGGPAAVSARAVKMSINEAHPEGRGACGMAFRSGAACIINDYLADPRCQAFHGQARKDGTRSGASFPLFARGQVVGMLVFVATEKDTFTPEFAELLQRLADNVSFALESFARVDEKAQADQRIEYLASHDSLTNLPNRDMFNEMLRRAIDAAQRYQRQFAVLFIDLDRFKIINDSLGHDAGDMLLVEIGGRLRRALRSSDVVARLGGDEFVVILEEAAERHEVERIASELLSVLGQPLQLSGHECHTTASIGIAMYPCDGADMQTLTKNADMAMYLAKEDGKNGFRFFTREIKTQSIERLTLESALRRAQERDQFSLHYQPKIDMTSGQITGVEALLRWIHPELGTISPGQFIPLAEETGLIVPIGRWVLKEACAQNMAWQRRGLRPVTMAVNLSPRQFADPHLLHDVDEALLASGMSPVLLQLEVTESMVMRNVSRAIKVLDAIQSRGIRLAIDDFGTGYSSMSLMKQFPIDTIKIDRSFVRDLPNDSEDQAIAQAIISMGKALGMTVIAEGVETVEQETFLRNHACDEMQGFLFSKPLPPREMANLLRAEAQMASPPLQPNADDEILKAEVRARLSFGQG